MGRASTRTLLPLDTFAKIMGINPVHFNGIDLPNLSPSVTCGQPMMQYDWQSAGAMSRETLATVIADAEDRISSYVGFKLLPTFEADERHPWPRSVDPSRMAMGTRTPTGQQAAVKMNWGHVIAAGVRRADLVEANAPIVWSDPDGDGYRQTATITTVTTVTDRNEIALYAPGTLGDPEWEIRPIKVVISGGSAVITLRRELLVIPALQEEFTSRAVDGSDDANFLPNVDVYRVWHDPSQQVHLLWEGGSTCGCGNSGCTTCYIQGQFGCAVVRNYRLGLVAASAGAWNSDTSTFESAQLALGRAPDSARFWYRAGYRDATVPRSMHEMYPKWARAVAHLAAGSLEHPLCECQNTAHQLSYWRDDLSFVKGTQSSSESYRTSARTLDNPFGSTRGALVAWRAMRMEQIGDSASL